MNQKTVSAAVFLSNSINRPANYRLAVEKDIENIISIAGERFVRYLNEIEASIYVCKHPLTHSKDDVNSEPLYPHQTHNIGIILGSHLIFLYLYESKYKIFPMSLEISFIFKTDYNKDANILYTRTKKLKHKKDQDDLDITNLKFLIKIKNLIEKISKKTKIIIFYTTEQRGYIYKKSLKHLKNIRIKPT